MKALLFLAFTPFLLAHDQPIHPFDYHGVTLDGGMMRRQFDEIRDYYLRIPDDDLLKGFRQRAGLPAPGADLGGWYTRDVFNIFGQILSALARMYAATGDPACREKLDHLIAEWSRTIEPDGFFYYTRKPNAPHYTYEKMVGGLVDAYLYGGNHEALRHLNRITDWAIKNLSQARPYSFNSATGDTEWYTLSENLYRAYLATHDAKYKDFAATWEYTRFWDAFAHKQDIFAPFAESAPFQAYHAYSHVNALNGAGAAYLVTGQPHYLDTLQNAYDFMVDKEVFATGGFGPNERLMPPGNNQQTLLRLGFHFETQCGTWAVFKLGKYLLSFTGDARYGDWMERVLINGIGASIPSSPDGSVFYFADYNINGASKANHNPWSCCAGTRPMAAADFHDIIYFHDDDNLLVAQFAPSSVTWSRKGATIGLVQKTRFPQEDQTRFVLTLDHPVAFDLKVRMPGWLAGPMVATVNHKTVAIQARQHWAVISRTWQNGDEVTMTLPAKFELAPVPGDEPAPVAIMRGPVTMAFRSPGGNPSSKFNFRDVPANFEKQPIEPLNYRFVKEGDVLLRPFYEFKEGEQYFMYLHPDLDAWSAPLRTARKSGVIATPWFYSSVTVGNTFEYPFTGRGIKWTGYRFADGGRAQISIDGAEAGTIDQFGPAHMPATPPVGPALPFEWESRSLTPGKHVLTIRTLDDKDSASTGHRITVDRIQTYP